MRAAAQGASCVIVQMRSASPSRIALEAAVDLARGLRSEVQSLFVEDERLFSLACLPCAREVPMTLGGRGSALSIERLQEEMRSAAASIRRELERLARSAEVPFRFGVVREAPDAAFERCCRDGAILAVAEPACGEEVELLSRRMLGEAGLSGLMLVGPRGRRRAGPVVIAAESGEDVDALLETGSRLRSARHPEVVLLVLNGARSRAAHHVGELQRLVEAMRPPMRLLTAEPGRGVAAAIANSLTRLGGGFLVARLSGSLAPGAGELRLLASAIECPVLLVR
jgi:hypothetical protein